MKEYQYLNSVIMVPKEWPLNTGGYLIDNATEQAIRNHKGVKICLTVSDVTGLVTNNQNGPGYIFKKIEEIHEDTGRIDLIVPVKVEIVMPELNLLGPTGEDRAETFRMNVSYDHPISRMLVPRSDRHVVLTAAPIIEEVLEKKGVRGSEMYNFAIRSIYIINNKSYNDILIKNMLSSSQSRHPSIFIARIGASKWIIAYYIDIDIAYCDRLSQH